jgi:hypothetical protein
VLLISWAVSPAAQTGGVTQVASDSFLALVPPRDLRDIEREVSSARQDQTAAASTEQTVMGLRKGADARIAAKKREISAIDGRRNTAKREKREAEIAALEAEKKALEREKDLLERRKSLREAEIDLAKKRGELAGLRRQALDLERQLAMKRAEQGSTALGGPEAARTNQVVFDLEKATLEAQRKRADKEREVTDREKRVIERKLQILQAQRALYVGR